MFLRAGDVIMSVNVYVCVRREIDKVSKYVYVGILLRSVSECVCRESDAVSKCVCVQEE